MPKKCKIFMSLFFVGWVLCGSVLSLFAGQGPEVIILDALVNIYGPAHFEHGMHEEVASCATCHHHTLGMPAEDEKCLRCHAGSGEADEITCAGCHSSYPGDAEKFTDEGGKNLYHLDITGLKRAYHLRCMGCHVEMEAANGCEDCHDRNEGEKQ